LTVHPVEATVSGIVVDVNGVGIPLVNVFFFNSAGAQVGSSVSGNDGRFQASVPTTAKSLKIDVDTADPIVGGTSVFYRQFAYGANDYLAIDESATPPNAGCGVTLPALTNGHITTLPNQIVLDARISGPPPPPTGCVGG